MMANAQWIRLGCVALVMLAGACTYDKPCQQNDPSLVKKFGVPKEQTEGQDGLCYAVDPEVPNWGASCDSLGLCGGGLICAAPDLPICTAVNCNADPKKDKVCGKGFTCIETGNADTPTICIPLPPAPTPTSAATTADAPSDDSSMEATDGGALDAAPGDVADAGESSQAVAVQPNIGTPCTSATDPVCVGGTFCEAAQLHYCTVANCASGMENEAVCGAVGFCYATPPAPASGICTVQ